MKSTIAACSIAGLALLGTSACGSSSGSADADGSGRIAPATPTALQETQIEESLSECSISSADRYFDIGDGGYTLSIDGEGEESAGADISDIACVLFELDVSDAVVGRIDNTRALDGTQEGSWGNFFATWSYHPDSGLSMIIEERSP